MDSNVRPDSMVRITTKELADKLCFEMDKGVTSINSMGWYKKSEGRILMVVVRKNRLQEVMGAIKEVDHNAFFTVSSVMGVYGEGFEEIKTGLKLKKNDNNGVS